MGFTRKEKDYIVDKAMRGYEPKEIQRLMRRDFDLEMTPSIADIKNFVDSEEGEDEIEIEESIKEKKAEIAKEDLVETLVTLKDDLESWHEELKDTEHGVTRNEAVKNIIDVVNKIGELIGELDRGGVSGNLIKIDEMQVNNVVQHLPKQKKQDIAEQLEKDDEIEDYVIKKRSDN